MKHLFEGDNIDAEKKHRIRKADICFVFAILAVAFAGFLIIKQQSTKGSYAVISYDGNALPDKISFEQSEPVYYLLTYENSDAPNSITMQKFSVKKW